MISKILLQNALHEAALASDEILGLLNQYNNQDAATSRADSPMQCSDGATTALRGPQKRLAEAATRLLQLSTDPTDYLGQLAANHQNLVCLRWLVNLNILEHIPVSGSIAYSDLAAVTNVPESQLKGVARMAIIHGFLSEPQPGLIAHSASSALLVEDQSFMNWARWMTNYSVPTAYKFPEATKRWGKTDAKHETAFSLAMNHEQPFFDRLRQDTEMNTMFSGYMRNVASTEGVSFKHLVRGFDWANLPAGATVVDVGGSRGHASVALAKQYPHLHFIVQDLPETIANANSNLNDLDQTVASRIKFMPHDFFQPQPITNANVYLLRMIIHDWPDQEATKILNHLRKAMMKAGACIVIMDTVLPQPGTVSIVEERQLRVRDLTMMQVFNAKERELEDWKNLTRDAGLELLHVEQPLGSNMGILQVGHQKETIVANGFHSPSSSILVNGNHEVQAPELSNGAPLLATESLTQEPSINGTSSHVNGIIHNGVIDQGVPTKKLPILIIGAGIGGLCLAQGLKKAGIDALVFERDLSEAYRPQGYRLKLEADAAAALRECLSAEVYKAFEASCAISAVGETDFDPISGACIKSRAGGGLAGRQGLQATYTVDRAVFRSILMTGIEDRIMFGKTLSSYTEGAQQSDALVAKFSDGSEVRGSFLVGADGSRSSVRKQHLPEHKFVDTGAICIYGKTNITPALVQRYPEKGLRWMTVCADTAPLIQSILIGDSPLTLLSEPIRFDAKSKAQTKQLPEDYIYWVLIGRKEMFSDMTYGKSADLATLERSAEESARQSLDLTKEWDPSMRSLFELQDVQQCSTLRVVSATPEIAEWRPSGSVTLIGDSIHAMSPCGGVGANTALRDASELAKVVADAGNDALTAEKVGLFEKDLRQRAFRSLMRSFAGSKKMFAQRPFSELPVSDL
ncbi:MAG: hypothetical protein M1822_003311 [Bathelium mastoideum]|nr:MAG: hypothetical protein M1822_003311 [Bathelium mastoideum]